MDNWEWVGAGCAVQEERTRGCSRFVRQRFNGGSLAESTPNYALHEKGAFGKEDRRSKLQVFLNGLVCASSGNGNQFELPVSSTQIISPIEHVESG